MFIFRDSIKKRKKKIQKCIKSCIIAVLIAAGVIAPILYVLLRKSTFYVTHPVTDPGSFHLTK
jgi:hypothetical protein